MITKQDFDSMPDPMASHMIKALEIDPERTEESARLFLLEVLLSEVRSCTLEEGSWQVMLRSLPESIMSILLAKIMPPALYVSIRTTGDKDPQYNYPRYYVHMCSKTHEPSKGVWRFRCTCEPESENTVYTLRTPVVTDTYAMEAPGIAWYQIAPLIDPKPDPKDIPLSDYDGLCYAKKWIVANDPLVVDWLTTT